MAGRKFMISEEDLRKLSLIFFRGDKPYIGRGGREARIYEIKSEEEKSPIVRSRSDRMK